MTLTRQRKRNLILLGSGVLGFVSGLFARQIGGLPTPALIGIWLVICTLVGWSSIYFWQLLDEAQREAHKWAWHWGGMVGLGLGVLILILISSLAPNLWIEFAPKASPGTFVRYGFGVAVLSMLAGYGAAWGAWWLARR